MEDQEISQLKPRRSISKARKKKRIVLIAAAVGVAILWAFFFELTIQLDGLPDMQLEYGSKYEEPGAAVAIRGRFFLKNEIRLPFFQPECISDLNESVLGQYTVSYRASILGKKAEGARLVRVVDTVCPEITFSRDWGANHVGVLYGIQATDNYDGDITDKVTYSRTKGWVTYSVMDSSGNPAYIVRQIPTDALEPPEIILEGENPYVITVGTVFEDPGYTAKDCLDADLTQYVEAEGEVDWLTPGTYSLTYTVSDSSENTTSITRDVIVEAKSRPEVRIPDEKTIYLTFDDGPGPDTERLLEILEQYGAKATFFVTGTGYGNVMGDIVSRGHSIGIHTVSHNYAQIYSSEEAYFEDVLAMRGIIYQNTGVVTSLLRFPGGSSNQVSVNASEGIMTRLTELVQDAGYQYFDWNVDSGDASEAKTADEVARNVIEGIGQKKTAIVLQHDIHGYSVDAVEQILKWGQENGYTFRPLTGHSPGFHHVVHN